MKTVKIQNTVNSADKHELEIYHTAISASNLLTSSVSSSGTFTGVDLFNGLTFQVEDDISQFFIKNITLCTNIGSGSLGESANNVFFFEFDPGDYGSLDINGTVQLNTAIPATARQNFALNPTLTVTSTANYPYVFGGWFTNSALTGSAISNANPLTLTNGAYSGSTSWYVRYQLGDNYY